MERNPLLPSIPELLLIGGIVLVVLVVAGVFLGIVLSNRSRARSARSTTPGPGDDPGTRL